MSCGLIHTQNSAADALDEIEYKWMAFINMLFKDIFTQGNSGRRLFCACIYLVALFFYHCLFFFFFFSAAFCPGAFLAPGISQFVILPRTPAAVGLDSQQVRRIPPTTSCHARWVSKKFLNIRWNSSNYSCSLIHSLIHQWPTCSACSETHSVSVVFKCIISSTLWSPEFRNVSVKQQSAKPSDFSLRLRVNISACGTTWYFWISVHDVSTFELVTPQDILKGERAQFPVIFAAILNCHFLTISPDMSSCVCADRTRYVKTKHGVFLTLTKRFAKLTLFLIRPLILYILFQWRIPSTEMLPQKLRLERAWTPHTKLLYGDWKHVSGSERGTVCLKVAD